MTTRVELIQRTLTTRGQEPWGTQRFRGEEPRNLKQGSEILAKRLAANAPRGFYYVGDGYCALMRSDDLTLTALQRREILDGLEYKGVSRMVQTAQSPSGLGIYRKNWLLVTRTKQMMDILAAAGAGDWKPEKMIASRGFCEEGEYKSYSAIPGGLEVDAESPLIAAPFLKKIIIALVYGQTPFCLAEPTREEIKASLTSHNPFAGMLGLEKIQVSIGVAEQKGRNSVGELVKFNLGTGEQTTSSPAVFFPVMEYIFLKVVMGPTPTPVPAKGQEKPGETAAEPPAKSHLEQGKEHRRSIFSWDPEDPNYQVDLVLIPHTPMSAPIFEEEED